MTQRLRFGVPDQLFGGAVENADAARGINADDAGARRRQHRLDEAAAAVDQVAGVDQFVALGAQLLRHLVEGLAELGEIALRLVHRHLHMQIAGRHDIGRAHQPPDRRNQPIGEIQADQNGGHQDGQSDHGKHQRERYLHAEAAQLQFGIFGDAGLRLVDLRDHVRIEQARDVEEGVVEGPQPDHGGDVIAFGKYRDFGLGFLDVAQEVRRRRP